MPHKKDHKPPVPHNRGMRPDTSLSVGGWLGINNLSVSDAAKFGVAAAKSVHKTVTNPVGSSIDFVKSLPNIARSFKDTATRLDDYFVMIQNNPGGKNDARRRKAREEIRGRGLQDVVNVASVIPAVKGVQTAAGAVAKTGIPARVVNKVTNQKVGFSATGNQLVSKFNTVAAKPLKFDAGGFPLNPKVAKLNPTSGSAGAPDKSVVWSYNPKTAAQGIDVQYNWAKEHMNRGRFPQIVITKQKTNTLLNPDAVSKKNVKDAPFWASEQPAKIVQSLNNPTQAQVLAALKRAGVKVQLNAAQRAFSKIEAKILAKRRRISDQNSPI